MGLFGKKKKKEEVTWDDIQASMQTPRIPEDQAEWFIKNKRSLADSQSVTNTLAAFPNSWINVETASVFISNRIPPACEKCEESNECPECGKSKSNFLFMMTANQDSDWLVWELARNRSSDLPDGLLVIFDPSVYSSFDAQNGLKFIAQDMAPIQIGTLLVDAIVSDQGMIHIADKYATQDSDFFISGSRVKAGEYQVVAWMGYNNVGDLTPTALGVYGRAFSDDLSKDLKLSEEAPTEIKQLIFNAENVLARMGNHQEEYADINASFYDENSPYERFISHSWSNQLIVEGQDKEQFFIWLMEMEMEVGARLAVLDGLRIRGKQSLALSYVDKIESKFQNVLTDRDRFTIEKMRTLPAGQFIIGE
jgi:hypothetical protein